MADLYRKSSLEKLSSPEQLDRMIVITSPSFWIAMLGVLGIVITALLWSVFGRLPVKVESSGIYVNSDGIFPVYSQMSGVVTEIAVREGQAVTAGQVLMRLSDDAQAHEMSTLQERIARVRVITLDSEYDEATGDNKDLIDIKTQYVTLRADLVAAQASLAQKQKDLAAQKAETAQLSGVMESAKAAYYGAINAGGSTAVQAEYQEASTVFSQAQSVFDNLKLQYQPALDAKNAADAGYLAAVEAYNAAVADPADAVPVELKDPDALGVDPALYPAEHTALLDLWTNGVTPAHTAEAQLKPSYDIAKADLDAATARMDAARAAYVQAGNTENANSAEAQKLSSEFQIAQSNYQNALSLEMSLDSEIKSLQQQVAAETQRISGQESALSKQFTSAREAILSQLETELGKYEFNQGQMEVVAAQDGVVSGLQVKTGAVVGVGAELARVKQDDVAKNVVVCYVPLSVGKKITPGMKAMVYPTTVNEQEYGFMEATVIKTDAFTTTSTDMMGQLGDNVLVESFLKDGPVVAVTCQLTEDPGTASGYLWSSAKGRDIVITEGTMVRARIVTEEKAPISMVIPLLKETFTVRQKAEG